MAYWLSSHLSIALQSQQPGAPQPVYQQNGKTMISFKYISLCMPSKSFLHMSPSLVKRKKGANCLNSWFAVLHTGKRWFIICPVEETPIPNQETPSDGTTQSPGSSATTQPADSGIARPSASRGDFVSTEQFQHKTSTASRNNSITLWQLNERHPTARVQ